MNLTISEFYKRQSPFSDPGKYAHLFEALPDDLPALASVVQGLIIPPYHLPLSCTIYALKTLNWHRTDTAASNHSLPSCFRFVMFH